jgi:ATP-dependent helicase/nuclease subunit B
MAVTGGGTAARVFVGAADPWPGAVREILSASRVEGDEIGMGSVTVIVPGGRARRHLLRLLAEHASRVGLRLVPPRIVLPGTAEEALREPLAGAEPVASDDAVALAWLRALDEAQPADRALLLPGGWSRFERRLRYAASLAGSHAELEAACGGVEPAAREAASLEGDPARYLALGRVAEAASRFLRNAGLIAPVAHRAMLSGQPAAAGAPVFVLGVFEASPGLRRLLADLAGTLTAIVVADEHESGRFDELGLARAGKADQRLPEAPLARIHVAGGPADQAERAVECLARDADQRQIDADQTVVVLADEGLAEAASRVFAGHGLGLHLGRGEPLRRRPELRILRRLAEHLREPTTKTLAALVLEPAFARLVEASVGEDGFDAVGVVADWRHDHPDRPLPDDGTPVPSRDPHFPQLCDAVGQLVAPLSGQLRLSAASAPVLDMLRRAFGDASDEDPARDAALAAVRDQLAAWEALDASLLPKVSGADAVASLAALVGARFVPIEPRADQIEAIGWLELPLDPARHVVVVGCNDGAVPSRIEDPFFPDSLRRRVGMNDGRMRAARDAAVFLVACARRAEFVLGRRGPTQDPLQPSRFLMQGHGADLAERVLALVREPEEQVERRPERQSFARLTPPEGPLPQAEWPTRLPVSAFKLYLQSPYHFWVQRILGAKPFELAGDELDPKGVGNVLHAVLEDLKTSDVAGSTDAERIGDWLVARLDAELTEHAGSKRDAVLRLQEQLLAQRLRRFARAQAGWAREGWQITEAEWKCERVLEIPGTEPILVYGTIDRVDRHEASGCWRIIDYKTGDSTQSPNSAHRGRDGEWRDLQLPLYRFLCEEELAQRGGGVIETGYVQLGKASDAIDFAPADKLDGWHDEAMSAARKVVQDIRGGQFATQGKAFEAASLEFLVRSPALRGGQDEETESGEGAE